MPVKKRRSTPRRTDAGARRQDAILKALIESPTDTHILTLDRKYRYTSFNASHRLEMKKLYGVDIKRGMCPLDVINIPTVKEAVRRGFDRALAGESFTTVEPQPGTDTWYEFDWSPIRSAAGKVVGLAALVRDITRRKRVETALAESEERYRRLVSEIGEGIGISDAAERFFFANRAADELFGVPRGGLIGRNLLDFLDAEQTEIVRQQTARRGAGHTDSYDLEITRPDGTRRITVVTASPWLDAHGRFAGSFAVFRDVTERKQAEQALSESEERFRLAFDHSPIGKSLTLPSGELRPNWAFVEMLGYTKEELEQLRWQDVTHPEDIDLTQRAIDPLLSGEKDSARIVKRFIRKDGTVVWGDMATSLRRDADGRPLYMMTSVIDVTERRQAEERLAAVAQYARSLLELSPDPLMAINADGEITDVNEATVKATGVPREQLVGTDFAGHFTEPDKARSGYQRVIAEGSVTGYPLTIKHRDGRLTAVLFNASVYWDAKGSVAGVLAAARTVTEHEPAPEPDTQSRPTA
ncbi:MAG TPA: PAS domain S-box protein [bacterium]|nr:PAS domain S-box protein [bacterium]